MELREFVTGVLDEIFEAISTEQKKYYEDCQTIPPVIAPQYMPNPNVIHNHMRKMDTIHFDLAITESSSSEKTAGGKAGISIVSFGGSNQKGQNNETIQKVSFDITVCYPAVTGGKMTPSGQG